VPGLVPGTHVSKPLWRSKKDWFAGTSLTTRVQWEDLRMAVRTGKQFLEALRDDRQIFIDGERVADVTKDRRLAAAPSCMTCSTPPTSSRG
jgi:hypothetical protein